MMGRQFGVAGPATIAMSVVPPVRRRWGCGAKATRSCFRQNMAKAQPDTAVWQIASGRDLACNGVCGYVVRHHVSAEHG